MKPFILIICLFFASSSFVYGQIKDDTNASREQKMLPSIIGDKPGKTEELRRFLNENLNMNLVADTNLKKGYVIIGCMLDASGKPKYFMEGTGENLYDYRTKIAKEFLRVANLITKWNPAEHFKDGLWAKIRLTFDILVRIPYNPNDTDGIVFLYIVDWGGG